jgi:hypothetical protein
MPADSSMKQKFHAAILLPVFIGQYALPFFLNFCCIPKPYQVYAELNLI